MTPQQQVEKRLYAQIGELLSLARKKVVSQVNRTMVVTYYEIGRIIVEHEQGGQERADYGKETLKGLSRRLSQDFGRGFSTDNLENMRRFYVAYSKSETLSRKSEMPDFQLSWSHYLKLLRMDDEAERRFFIICEDDGDMKPKPPTRNAGRVFTTTLEKPCQRSPFVPRLSKP